VPDSPPLQTPSHCALCGSDLGIHAPDCPLSSKSNIPFSQFFDDSAADTLTSDPLVGKNVGEYRIIQRIGAGGWGIVYEGVQPLIGRKVAVKILRPDVAGPEQMRGLLEEARAANATRHRGIIDVFGFGELPGIGQYLVMDFLEGEPLSTTIERQAPMLETEVLPVLDQVAESLAVLHETGLIHRDLKPNNIFLVNEPGGRQFTKLLDFGLAKVRREKRDSDRQSGLVGTPEYMAPEQISSGVVSARTDLYALGVVAFEMLSGTLPIDGENPVEVARNQIVQSPKPLPSGVSAAMADLVLRLLSKDPAHRPASGRLVHAELKGIAQRLHEQTTALIDPSEVPAAYRSTMVDPAPQRPTRRLLWAGLAAAVLCALAAGGWWFWPEQRAPAPANPAPAVLAEAAPGPPETPDPLEPTRVTAPLPAPHAPPTPRPVRGPRRRGVAPAGASKLSDDDASDAAPAAQTEVTNGWLKIRVSGRGPAEMYLDDEAQPRGHVPSTSAVAVAPGRHRIRLKRTDRVLGDQSVQIVRGLVTEVSFRLDDE
jgi:serine/threonine protein kinase